MRDIRARIGQPPGLELSNQQIQDLAARRLESILDPRVIDPTLLERLRKADAATPTVTPKASNELLYTFDHTTIYDSPRAVLRFIRRLLNPLLKLFFNPNPLIRVLHLQSRLNVETAERDAAREAERDRRQNEWNALHYEILQRLVTDVSRMSIEVQALSMRVESLKGRVDFNDRRVRGMEGATPLARAGTRATDAGAAPPVTETVTAPEAPEGTGMEGGRRRRRRRRGRRSGGGFPQGEQPSAGASIVSSGFGQTPTEKATSDTPLEEPTSAPADVTAPVLEHRESGFRAESERPDFAPAIGPPSPAPPSPAPLSGTDDHAPAQESSSSVVEQPDIDHSEQ
jgi:hypothetical protein